MATLKLIGSVGSGSAKKGLPHNDLADFQKVRRRFVELGYSWVESITDPKNRDFLKLIKLFQSIVDGRVRVDRGDSRIDLHGNTHRWLAAENAPGWVNMENKSGFGWKVVGFDYKNAYATTWMEKRIQWAGMQYCLTSNFQKPPMWIRDFSRKKGGKTTGHGTHQTGLNVDMRLPLKEPNDLEHYDLNKREHDYDKLFDREAARAQLKAIKDQMDTKVILFNDPYLRGERLCQHYANHGNHYHITIRPPKRVDGRYT